MSLRRDPFEALTLDQKAHVNNVCEQFEHALTSGSMARIEDSLDGEAEPVRSVLLRELLLLECVDRIRRADPVKEEDLLIRFPGSAEMIGDVVREACQYATPPAASVSDGLLEPGGSRSPRKLGRFVLKQLLSGGGFATVYLAEDPEHGRVVALKVPHVEILLTPALRRRFVFEAEAAALLEHPHIVQVIEVGEMGLLCYLASQYVPGTTLSTWLKERKERGQPVPIDSAARLVATLAEAMQHAHERGVLHCDLKPANVLLADGPDLFPVITDFGLARLIGPPSGLSQTGQILGTPAYMAPEQAAGRRKDLTPRSDVWALGAILYEMLVGATPFAGGSMVEVLHAVLNEDALPLRARRRDVPADLEAICLKCLEKKPEARYPSAAALAEDLGRWLRGEPVQARRTGLFGRAGRWCRRRPVVAALTAALSLAVVAGITGVVDQWREAEGARREAEASEAQTQQLLSELLQPGQAASRRTINYRRLPSIDVLLKAEVHLKARLDKSPDNIRLRIALTNLRGSLGTLYGLRGQVAEMEAALKSAQDLWEPLVRQDPRNPEYRDWLANTCYWHARSPENQGQPARWLRMDQQSFALWQELADEQPGNTALLEKVAEAHLGLLNYQASGEEILHELEAEKNRLGKLADEEPVRADVRKCLGLTYFVMGEVQERMRSPREAQLCWRQAYEQYKKLPEAQSDDPLARLTMALCCSRLMEEQHPNPHYSEAVSLFEQAAQRLAGLADQYPDSNWIPHALLETYCSLAVCQWKAGLTDQAERTFQARVRPLVALATEHTSDAEMGVNTLASLDRAAGSLERLKSPDCLLVAREIAALADRCADAPLRDWMLSANIAGYSLSASVLLCRQGCPAEALPQAERSRRLYEALRRAIPDVLEYGHGLSDAWQRIAKARWALGQHDEALVAFRECAAAQRKVVEQAPSIHVYRVQLNRCYGFLVYWGGLRGDRATVADALLEQEKLWPENSEELMGVSGEFRKLAESVGQSRERLSPEEQAERQRYLAESERIRRAAEQHRR
jgi:tetratricopeptide (TPR) repeat protein